MAIPVPASPFGEAYFNVTTEGTFPDDRRSIGLYSSFGEDGESNASFGSWPDPYSCSSEVSSFPSVDSTPFTSLLNSPSTTTASRLPSEDDLNIIAGASPSELLEHFGCCHPHTPVMMHSDSVDTPKQDMLLSPDEMSQAEMYVSAEENHFAPLENQYAPHLDNFPGDNSLEGGRIHEAELIPGDCFRVSYDDDYVEEEEPSDVAVDPVHIPPPLNMKRIEMYDDAYYESIEAAEVPLDVIENKRPFQCGLAGCDKTFKNPQTMKMHHKTHFSDGSAVEVDALLPTLTAPGSGSGGSGGSSGSGGSPASWMAGRSKKIPSRCPKCRKTFVGLYELRRHYGRKHSEGERPFQCRKCDKRFYIEVDVRDHEKLCGEQVECKCGLKFAFKCNMVAHKKAHPACRALQAATITTTTTNAAAAAAAAPARLTTNPSTNSTSVTIMNSGSNTSSITNSSGYQSTLSDEDSSRSRWISRSVSPGGALARDPGRKRCHELVEQSRPDLMANFTTCVYSRRPSHSPAQAPAAPATPDVDFAALCDASGTGTVLWSPSNLHYSVLPWSTSSVFGSLDQFQPRGAVAGKLSALDLLQLAGLTPGLGSL